MEHLEKHRSEKPEELESMHTGGLEAQNLRILSDDLALEEPEIEPSLKARWERAHANLEASESRESQSIRSSAPFFLRPFIFLYKLITKIARFFFGRGLQHVDYAAKNRALEELRKVESELGDLNYHLNDIRRRKKEAIDTLISKGLPTIAGPLSELIRSAEESELWQNEDQPLHEKYERAQVELEKALRSRGVSVEQSVVEALEAYEQQCVERETQFQRASDRAILGQRYQTQMQQEAVGLEADLLRKEVILQLNQAAQMVGRSCDVDNEVVEKLRQWIGEAKQLSQEQEEAKSEWEELVELLNGQTLDDLAEEAARRTREAEQLAIDLDPETLEQTDMTGDAESLLARLRLAVGLAESALAEKRGSLEQFARNITSVAEAEEELVMAEHELSRVRTLEGTLAKTQELLQVAQERVHRNVAPVLREALKPWLKAVTGGRYRDVRVDAETLEVYVLGEGRNWRKVGLLSHGTAEQIYLLLRVAMSRHLVKRGEICPLILDDVTVHCDQERQTEMLSLLHEISEDQQVILFSQEPETLMWAKEHLLEDRDKFIELDPSLISA